MTAGTQVHSIAKHQGIAGQFSVVAKVQYEDEPTRTVEFVGSVYGGPVVMRTEAGDVAVMIFVTDPERFGEFGTDWVRRFFDA